MKRPEEVWRAAAGRIGGRVSSPAKAAAARANGKKGGRPRKPRPPAPPPSRLETKTKAELIALVRMYEARS